MNGLIPSAPARALMWPSPLSAFLGHLVYYDLVQRQTAYRLDDRYSFPRSPLWGVFSFPRVRGSSSRAASARPPTTAPSPSPPIGVSQANDGASHVTRTQWRRRSVEPRYKTGLMVSLGTFRFRFISIALISTERFPFHSQIFYRHFVRVIRNCTSMLRDKGRIK